MARGRGGTGMAIAVVIFAMLFVLTTVVAIVVYSENEDLKNNASEAQSALLEYRTNAEHTNDDVRDLRDKARKDKNTSVVGILRSDRDWLISQIDPKRNKRGGIEATLDSLMKTLNKDADDTRPGLVNIINDLVSDVDTLRNRASASEATVTKQAEEAKTFEAQVAALSQKYQDEVTALKAQLAAIENDNKAAQTNAQQQFVAVETTTKESAEKAQTEIGKLETELIQKEAKIRDLQNALEELRTVLNPRGDGVDPSLEPDGAILSSLPDSGVVTINLTSNDRLFRGLAFEVFDKKLGVAVKDQFGDVRGKATIEVVTIKGNTTECRVVRKDRNATIFEGDIIANVVYDKHRTYKFFVFGDFDINNDERSTAAEQRRIKSMIEQWGGEVAKKMSYDIDFLVLGRRPVIPSKKDVTDPREIERIAALERKEQEYLELEGEARTFRVPILNQNRFLTLVGYYDRNAVETPKRRSNAINPLLSGGSDAP